MAGFDPTEGLPLLVSSIVAAILGTFLLFSGGKSPRSLLLTRRSHVKYSKKKVPQGAVDRALEAAILAPNHFLSEPWRFYQCGVETIKKFAELNTDKAAQFLAVPGMMVVSLKSKHKLDEKLGLEDHAAVSCAVQNFMLSLHAEGVASKWMTGAMMIPPDKIMEVVGAPDDEKMMAVVWFGYAGEKKSDAPKRKLGVAGVYTKLP